MTSNLSYPAPDRLLQLPANTTNLTIFTTTVMAALTDSPVFRPAPLPAYVQTTKFVCDQVLLPVICCLGILGNGLSLCVLTRREMAAATTSFLTSLAVTDLLLLSLQLPTFLQTNSAIAASQGFQIFIRHYTIVRYVLNNILITCTCWLTVAVSVERFLSLRYMFHPRLTCTIPRARVAVTVIYLLSAIFHFSKVFEYTPQMDLSLPQQVSPTRLLHSPGYETYVHVTNIALAAIIPVLLLLAANSFLIYFLLTHRRRMLTHKFTSPAMTSVDMLHVTGVVVATVLVFLACHVIGVVLALTIASHPSGRRHVFQNPIYLALKHVNTVLVMLNSSVNFILYCAISRKFRNTFIALTFKRNKRRDPWTSAMPLSESNNGAPPILPRHGNGTVYSSSSKSGTVYSSPSKSPVNSTSSSSSNGSIEPSMQVALQTSEDS